MAERAPRRNHDREDVSNGRERIPVPWRNEFWTSARGEQQGQGVGLRGEKRGASGGSDEVVPKEPPSDWMYMACNTPHEKARINMYA